MDFESSYFKPPYSLSSTNVAQVVLMAATRIIKLVYENKRG